MQSRAKPPRPESGSSVVDDFQRRLNRLLGLAMLAGIVMLGLAGFTDVFGGKPFGPAIAYAGAGLCMAAGAAAIALPLVVFGVARLRGPREEISRALRNMARLHGFALGAVGVFYGVAAEPLVRGIPSALVGVAALAVATLALREDAPPRSPAPSFGATGFAMVAGLLVVILFANYFGDTRDRAYVRTMTSDLRNYLSAQEIHLDSAGEYSSDATLGGSFITSPGVTLSARPTDDGWIAETRHAFFEGRCVLFEGGTAEAPATEPRIPACETPGLVAPHTRWVANAALAVLLAGAVLAWLARRSFVLREA